MCALFSHVSGPASSHAKAGADIWCAADSFAQTAFSFLSPFHVYLWLACLAGQTRDLTSRYEMSSINVRDCAVDRRRFLWNHLHADREGTQRGLSHVLPDDMLLRLLVWTCAALPCGLPVGLCVCYAMSSTDVGRSALCLCSFCASAMGHLRRFDMAFSWRR